MKKINFFNVKTLAFVVLFTGASLVSCDDNRRDYEQPLNDYEAYVDRTSNNTGEWTEERWNETEAEYRERRAAVEQHADKMDDQSRTRYQEADRRYEDLRRQYDEQRASATQQSGNVSNLYAVVGASNSNDLQLNNVTADNLLETYRGFVDQVEANKDNYSVEDWKELEIIWDALNRRKNEVEPNLASADNMKIAELKVKYGWIKTGNKMEAKAEEKSENNPNLDNNNNNR